MTISYSKVMDNDTLWIERADDHASSDLRIKILRDGAQLRSDPLSTYEIGLLSYTLALIYYGRTRKLPMQPTGLDDVERVKFKELDREGIEPSATKGAVLIRHQPADPCATCEFCFDECTGECL